MRSKLQRFNLRSRRAATMGLVIVLSFVLVLLVLAFFYFGLSFGASQETRNAVDAGALNVGKEVLSLTISPDKSKPGEDQFEDVADTQGKFGLTNINRAMAKALLVNLNLQAMSEQGQSTGEAERHADLVFAGAESISARLADTIKKSENLYPLFDAISSQNSAQMLGSQVNIKSLPGEKWNNSYVDRGAESNMLTDQGSFPATQANKNISLVKAKDSQAYLPGYTSIEVGRHNFNFIPYKKDERPHLIAAALYNSNKVENTPLSGWKNPLPNAFSTHGQSTRKNSSEHDAISFVQTNPQRTFKFSIPHSFIRIKLDKNNLKFRVNGMSHPEADMQYDFVPPKSTSNTFPDGVGVGTVSVSATVGLEYVPPTLFQAIYALPGDHSNVSTVLLQRCREFKPACSEAELNQALSACALQAGINEYLIFPVGDDKEGKNIKLAAAASTSAAAQAPWLKKDARPDGKEMAIANEFVGPIPQPSPAPNIAIVSLFGPGVPVFLPSFITEFGVESWTPGTGYDQCLGELRIERETTIDANGFVEAVVP